MLTINAETKSDGKRIDGTYNVKLRFTLNRKMKRLSTSLFATPRDLTKELKIKQSSPIKREVEFNHSSVSITKRYLGLRQEEILQTYDCLSF